MRRIFGIAGQLEPFIGMEVIKVAEEFVEHIDLRHRLVTVARSISLDACLKSDASATASLKRRPLKNGVPKHFIATSFRIAQSVSQSHAAMTAQP
jgi:hypothetical protein